MCRHALLKLTTKPSPSQEVICIAAFTKQRKTLTFHLNPPVQRTVKVPPELGYGDRGEQEIPPGATFDLLIEVLRVGE